MDKDNNRTIDINTLRPPLLRAGSGVFFDLDGTLVDTAPDFLAVIIRMCEANKITPPSPAAVHATVSSGARALVTLAFQLDSSHDRFPTLLETLLEDYAKQIMNTQAGLYPEMDRLLDLLDMHTIPWGVVTNKPERFSKPLLDSLGLTQRCAVLVCPDHVKQSKPHPEALQLACSRTSTVTKDSIYIGDHPRDIEAGNAAGMTTLAAAFGYLPETPDIRHWGADHIVNSTQDIIDFFWPHHNQNPAT